MVFNLKTRKIEMPEKQHYSSYRFCIGAVVAAVVLPSLLNVALQAVLFACLKQFV